VWHKKYKNKKTKIKFESMTNYSQGTSQTREGKSSRFRIFLSCILSISIVAALVGYLFEVNYITAKGYEIRNQEKQISALREENEKLKIKIVEIQSMTSLKKRVEELKMVPVDQVVYYDFTKKIFAKK
jgi:Tfp pilus assembly protein PilN